MKSKLGLGLISGVSIVLVLLLASCSNDQTPPMKANVKKYDITFQAKGDPKRLDIDSDTNSKCKREPAETEDKYGCISVAADDQAVITFDLKTGSWHMTEMVICKGDTKDTQDCNLSTEEQQEFAVMEMGGLSRYHPDEHGVIKFSDIPQRISEFKLIDLNQILGDYFYTLKACKSGNTTCAESDPPIKNGGKR
jgi:hypothetical protein